MSIAYPQQPYETPPPAGQVPDEPDRTPEQAPARPAPGTSWRSIVRSVWMAATSAHVTVALSALIVLLLSLALVMPQLPAQLDSEAGAADRWLAAAAASSGALGGLLRGLGLFQIMQSPVLQLLLALLFFVLLVQLARLVMAAYALGKVPDVLDRPLGTNGEPLPVPAAGTLLRWRSAHPAPPLVLASDLQRLLDARLRHVERRTVRVAPAPLGALNSLPQADSAEPLTLEERLLALRGSTAAWLRPLLVLGMLAAAALIWASATFGWAYTADNLAPGERMADPIHDLRFEYRIDQPTAGLLQPNLVASVGGDSAVIPVEQEMQKRVGNVVVHAEPGAPGLIIQTVNGELLLARPGQATPVSSIGLGFPSVGSEETLLLPQQAAGLRLVRVEQGAPGPADDGFLVEVFVSGNEQAVLRTVVAQSEIVSIPTPSGSVVLAITPLPNLSVQVQHNPAQWLLWVALALGAAGALGFWQQSGFVLAQIGPWPPERAVVTVQSDLPGEMESLKRWYSESTERGGSEL